MYFPLRRQLLAMAGALRAFSSSGHGWSTWKCVASVHSPRSLRGKSGEGLKGCESVKGTEVTVCSS